MGQDKASLVLDGEPFLSRICRVIASVVHPIVVVSSDDQQLPVLPNDVAVVPDLWQDEGPLAGLLTGLEFLAQHWPNRKTAWLGSCDTPCINSQVVQHMCQTPGTWNAAMVQVAGRHQPFGAVYATSIRDQVQSLFESGERRLGAIAPLLDVSTIEAESLRKFDPSLSFLQNVNTPEDYQALRHQS